MERRKERPSLNGSRALPSPMSLAHETSEHACEEQHRQTDEHRNAEADGKQQQTRTAEISPTDVSVSKRPDKMHHDIDDWY